MQNTTHEKQFFFLVILFLSRTLHLLPHPFNSLAYLLLNRKRRKFFLTFFSCRNFINNMEKTFHFLDRNDVSFFGCKHMNDVYFVDFFFNEIIHYYAFLLVLLATFLVYFCKILIEENFFTVKNCLCMWK